MKRFLLVALMLSGVCGLSAASNPVGLETLGHIAIGVSNAQRAMHFYVDILGLKKTFIFRRPDGSIRQAYLQVDNSSTFVELFPVPQHQAPTVLPRPDHFGFFVKNLDATLHALKSRGYPLPADAFAMASKPKADGTYLYFIHDPDGNRIELSQITPNSYQGRALRKERERR